MDAGPDGADGSVEDAPDAFQALGSDVRLSVLQHLLDAGGPVRFSTLHEASSVEQSAGFAYHLRQLDDRYVRKVDEEGDEGYVLTDAGRRVARAVAAGTYVESVDLDPVELDDPCPLCGAGSLVAEGGDNTVGIACRACDRPVLSLPFPPGGYRDRDPETVPDAFDAHHRHRLSLLREGVCPDCSGTVTATVEPADRPSGGPPDEDGAPGERSDDADGTPRDPSDDGPDGDAAPPAPVRATFECEACGRTTRSPLAPTLLTHPAVVAFYRDHGRDPRDRPIWNVGPEWREALLSTDPLAAAVSVELDGDLLELFVDGRASVVETRRTPGDDDPAAGGHEAADPGATGTGAGDGATTDAASDPAESTASAGTATAGASATADGDRADSGETAEESAEPA